MKLTLKYGCKEREVGVNKEGGRSVDVDHPIVSVLGKFVVASFNNACRNGEHNHLCNSNFTEFRYLKSYNASHFST